MFGIKIQIAGSDDSYLCNNDLTIASALVEDEKKLRKKEKKSTVDKKQSSDNSDSLSIEEIILKVKEQYSTHEDYDELIDDLSSRSSLSYWAEKFIEEDFGNNKELAESLLVLMIDECDDTYDYKSLAEKFITIVENKDAAIEIYKKALNSSGNTDAYIELASSLGNARYLNDKKWAKEVYEIALETCWVLKDLINITNGICTTYGNSDWSIEIINDTVEKLKSADLETEFYGDTSNVVELANFIAQEDGLNNVDMAKEVYNLLKKSQNVTNLLDAARAVQEIYGEEYFKEYSQEILNKAIEHVDDGYYCDLYYFIKDDLGDNKKADEYKDDYYKKMESDYKNYDSCEELFGNNSDSNEIDFDDYEDKKSIIGFAVALGGESYNFDDGSDEFNEYIYKRTNEFIQELKESFNGIMGEQIVSTSFGAFQDYNDDDKRNYKYDDEDYINLYIKINKQLPIDKLDAIFLSMNEYEFYAKFENDDEEVIVQGYDQGEYDTGYFSDGDEYTNDYVCIRYSVAKRLIK